MRAPVTLMFDGRRQDTLLLAMDPRTTMHRFESAGAAVPIPERGVLLGEGMRVLLGVAPGDEVTMTLTQSGRQVRVPVVGFVDEFMSPLAYTSATGPIAGELGLVATGAMARLRPGADASAVSARIATDPQVVAYLSTASLATAMRETFGLYDALVMLSLFFAAVMAMAMLYNAMSANVAERSVELGTLQASGMPVRSLGRLIGAENLILVIAALPIGLGVGAWLADAFLGTFESDGFSWHLSMQASTPLLVAGVVLAAALVVQWPALRAVRRMDIARIVRERSL